MKKLLLIFTIIFFPHLNYGQKWHLEKIYSDNDYKYEYWFSFQNEDDTNSFELIETTTKNDVRKIHGSITNSNNEPIIYANIIIKDSNGNIVSKSISDSKGHFSIDQKVDNVEIIISSLNYDELSLKINLKNNTDADLKIKLGKAPELETYQINSKTELSNNEINEIIACVKKNRDLKAENYLQNCTNNKKFRLSIQI